MKKVDSPSKKTSRKVRKVETFPEAMEVQDEGACEPHDRLEALSQKDVCCLQQQVEGKQTLGEKAAQDVEGMNPELAELEPRSRPKGQRNGNGGRAYVRNLAREGKKAQRSCACAAFPRCVEPGHS